MSGNEVEQQRRRSAWWSWAPYAALALLFALAITVAVARLTPCLMTG